MNLWTSAEHALDYLRRADSIPHRVEGQGTLLEFLSRNVRRVLDLGSGDGRLLALVLAGHPTVDAVALDFSPTMLERVRLRFAPLGNIQIVEHNLEQSLPTMGRFDAVVSSFAIHHVPHQRKRDLYSEIFAALEPGGVFANLEHVASPTPGLHRQWLQLLGIAEGSEDPSNKLLDVETQLQWLREIGFTDVDCHWKWRELALLAGTKNSAKL